MANVEHFEVYAGEDRSLTVHARNSSNAVVSLTGKTLTFYVGRPPMRPDNTTSLITKTGSTVSASAGTSSITIAASDTLRMDGDYEHMSKTVDSSGNTVVVSRGRFRVLTALVS